jgi:hypothetical protein
MSLQGSCGLQSSWSNARRAPLAHLPSNIIGMLVCRIRPEGRISAEIGAIKSNNQRYRIATASSAH